MFSLVVLSTQYLWYVRSAQHFHLPAPDPTSPHATADNPDGRVLPRLQKTGLKSLRTVRLLEARMVLTIEPGLYFNDAVLLVYLQVSII